jgi:hypothetical protein
VRVRVQKPGCDALGSLGSDAADDAVREPAQDEPENHEAENRQRSCDDVLLPVLDEAALLELID